MDRWKSSRVCGSIRSSSPSTNPRASAALTVRHSAAKGLLSPAAHVIDPAGQPTAPPQFGIDPLDPQRHCDPLAAQVSGAPRLGRPQNALGAHLRADRQVADRLWGDHQDAARGRIHPHIDLPVVAAGYGGDEPLNRSMDAGAGTEGTRVDRVHPGPASEEARKRGNQGGQPQPGKGGPVMRLGRPQSGEPDHRDGRDSEGAQRGIRGSQRSHGEPGRRAREGGEAPFADPPGPGLPAVFHPVVTWYAALNASFDRLED